MNISVGILYLESWLGGNGCIPVNYLMEDAATAEIGRTQVRILLSRHESGRTTLQASKHLHGDHSFWHQLL